MEERTRKAFQRAEKAQGHAAEAMETAQKIHAAYMDRIQERANNGDASAAAAAAAAIAAIPRKRPSDEPQRPNHKARRTVGKTYISFCLTLFWKCIWICEIVQVSQMLGLLDKGRTSWPIHLELRRMDVRMLIEISIATAVKNQFGTNIALRVVVAAPYALNRYVLTAPRWLIFKRIRNMAPDRVSDRILTRVDKLFLHLQPVDSNQVL